MQNVHRVVADTACVRPDALLVPSVSPRRIAALAFVESSKFLPMQLMIFCDAKIPEGRERLP
jgi:hypothetical protein